MSARPELRVGVAVPSLVRWGLSPDADLVYRDLVTLGPLTSRGVGRDLGMPVRRVDAAAEELVAAGAVTAAPVLVRGQRRPLERGWRAVPAADVLAALRRRRLRVVDADERARRHHAVIGTVLAGDRGTGGLGTVLPGSVPTRARIAELAAAERHEHLALNPEPSFTAEAVAAALPLDRQLHARGVRVRICGLPPADGDASTAAVERLAALGDEYRERMDIPVKLMIFDRRVALLPADPLDLAAGAVEIDHPAVVAAMAALFEEVWMTARDPRKTGVPPIVMTAREQAIVGLLAQGHTDISAAQRLGLSQRTIGYALRSLMDRLGVENRFQLGLVLGAAHAATPPDNHEEET